MESLEVSAKTVKEAIEIALARLGKRREEVYVSVLSEGSRGILGIGSEDARILVSVPEEHAEEAEAEEALLEEEEEAAPPAAAPPEPLPPEQIAEVAKQVLEKIMSGLEVAAKVNVRPGGNGSEGLILDLDVMGPDQGMLIGRRGETLGALQFLTNLIVSKRLHRWVRVTVDVEGYRAKREQSLKGLALRTAQRVQETRQPVALEPMPPNERRIVHLALQDHPAVTTVSIGEGDRRKVVISPRR